MKVMIDIRIKKQGTSARPSVASVLEVVGDRIESGQQGGAGHIRGDHGWVLAYTFTSEPDDEGVTSEPPEREEPERRSSRQAITAHANAETR